MTTATKEKPKTRTVEKPKTRTVEKPKTREQELEEEVAYLDEQLTKLNANVAHFEQAAIDADRRIQELLDGSFGRPFEGIPEDIDAARQALADAKASIDISRRRAEAFLRKFNLEQLRAELRQLQSDRELAEVRSAAEATHKANLAEYEVRVELLDDLKLQIELEFGRCRQLILELRASERHYGFATPTAFDDELFKTSVQERLAAIPRVTLDAGGGQSISFHRATPEQLAQGLARVVADGDRLKKEQPA